MVIHGVMQKRVASPLIAIAVVFSASRAKFAVATTVGDAAEFFDIHMHQFPRGDLFIPDGFGLSHRQASGLIEVG